MANLTRYDPFGLTSFDPFADVDDMFRDFFRSPLLSRQSTGSPHIMPFKMDVDEHDNEYVICADMPGVKKEDIKISIDGNQITIDAEVKREAATEGGAATQAAGGGSATQAAGGTDAEAAGSGATGGGEAAGGTGAEAGGTAQAESKPGRNLRTERYYGRIYRSFMLPQEVDQEGAKARLEHGVLKLTLPKRQAAGAKQISIE